MAGLRDLMRAVQLDLPVTVRMERWLIDNADPTYSEEAIQFSDDVLRGKVGGNRKNRTPAFRASGFGKCLRSRVFARIGTVGISEQLSSAQSNTYASGNVFHRKWQMAGLTEGWLTEAEVPLHSVEHDLGGTADGVIYDGSLFEYKTINDRGYKWVAAKKSPSWDHLRQVAAYKLLRPELTAASVIYENKNTGEWREYRVYFTDEVMEPMLDELAQLHQAMANRELPPILEGCLEQKGEVYRRCPFRESCLKTKIWPKGAGG